MADESPEHLRPESRKRTAVKMIRRQLIEMGANPEDAAAAAESVSGHLYVADDPKTPILCRKLGGALADTYPPSFTDPVGDLTAALFSSLRDEQKLVATQKRDQEVAEIMEQKRRSGQYL
jgi:hypothetical protein